MSCEVLILMLDIDTYVQEVTDVWGDGVVCGPRSYITRGGGGGVRGAGGAQAVAPFVEPDSILLFVTDVNAQELAEPEEGQEDEEERWESNTVSQDDDDHARAAHDDNQAKLNKNPSKFGTMGRHPNVTADAERGWLVSKDEITASEVDALYFSEVTVPSDQGRSAGYTSALDREQA